MTSRRIVPVAVAQLISFPPAVERYSAELLARQREVPLSKKSGKRSVEYKLEKMKVKTTPDQVDEVLKKVKELGLKKKRLVNDDEFKVIVKEVLNDLIFKDFSCWDGMVSADSELG